MKSKKIFIIFFLILWGIACTDQGSSEKPPLIQEKISPPSLPPPPPIDVLVRHDNGVTIQINPEYIKEHPHEYLAGKKVTFEE